MAIDLSRVQPRGTRRSQPSRNRDSFIRQRETRSPGLEVNAPLTRPKEGGARELKQLLGLTSSLAGNVADIRAADRAEKSLELTAEGSMAFATGDVDQDQLDRQESYYTGYMGAKAASIAAELDRSATKAVNDCLDTDDCSPAQISQLLDDLYSQHLMDPETGEPLDFGTPQATALIARQAGATRRRLLGEASPIIARQVNDELIVMRAHQEFRKGTEQSANLVEFAAPEDGIREVELPPSNAAEAAPTGRLPVQGTVTNTFDQHQARGSVGVDIDGQMGDPIEAPSGGTVTVGRDSRSGLFVKIDHGGGIVSTYSHLSATDFKDGDTIQPGDTLGLVGNSGRVSKRSGDGSHLHWRVKVDGKDVDPLSFQFPQGAAPTALAQAPTTPEGVPKVYPNVCFECAMTDLVAQGVPRAQAKAGLLTTFINIAKERGDPALLRELSLSVQADGKTPSFNPEETAKLLDTRNSIIERNHRMATRARSERWEAGEFTILANEVNGEPLSDAEITAMHNRGEISPNFAYSMLQNREAERAAEQRAREARQDRAIDLWVSAETIARREGIIEDDSYETDLALYNSGQLGSGPEATARLHQLRTAARAGSSAALNTPDAKYYYTRLKQAYDSPGGDSGMGRVGNVLDQSDADPTTWPVVSSAFVQKVKAGVPPAQAVIEVMAEHAPDSLGARQAGAYLVSQKRLKRLKELEAKAAGG